MGPFVRRALEPYQRGTYVNFLDRDDHNRLRTAYDDEAHARLAEIKSMYDPDNVFRSNHNIEPARARVRARVCKSEPPTVLRGRSLHGPVV